MTSVGIIGAGQLGQMLGAAGIALGTRCSFLDPSPNPPAASVGNVISRPFDDAAGLAQLAAVSDIITYEFENVPVAALSAIPDDVPVYPPAIALDYSQDRLAEKKLFDELEIPLPAYRAVDSEQDLRRAIDDIGLPIVLKTRRLGYDGKGQMLIRSTDDIGAIIDQLGSAAPPMLRSRWKSRWIELAWKRNSAACGCRRSTSNSTAAGPS